MKRIGGANVLAYVCLGGGAPVAAYMTNADENSDPLSGGAVFEISAMKPEVCFEQTQVLVKYRSPRTGKQMTLKIDIPTNASKWADLEKPAK